MDTNMEDLAIAENTSKRANLLMTQPHWDGHVSRMPDNCLPKIMLFGDQSSGHYNRGTLKKCYNYVLKMALNVCRVDPWHWTTNTTGKDD